MDGKVGDVDADPLPAELLRRMYRRPAAAEGVEDHVALVGEQVDQPLRQLDGEYDNLRAALGLGSALAAQGRYDAAEKELRRALKLAPDATEVNYQLGYTLYKKGVYAAAATQLRRAVDLDPDHGAAFLVLGEALNQMAESDAAIDALESSISTFPITVFDNQTIDPTTFTTADVALTGPGGAAVPVRP